MSPPYGAEYKKSSWGAVARLGGQRTNPTAQRMQDDDLRGGRAGRIKADK